VKTNLKKGLMMTKTREDGSTYEAAMYARVKGTNISELISTDDYDVTAPTEDQQLFAEELFGLAEDIEFFEEEC